MKNKKTTKKNTPRKSKKKDIIDLSNLNKKLIKPTRSGSAHIDLDKDENLTTFKQNLMKINSKTYQLTPKGIMWAALDTYYHIGTDMDKYDLFQEELMKHFSMLASNNKMDDMFGKDINDFFETLIKTLNLTGKMKELLDKNGIEFDIRGYLTNDIISDNNANDNSTDDPPDEDDGIKKPKHKK